MYTYHMYHLKTLQKTTVVVSLITFFANVPLVGTAYAVSVTDLQHQQAALEQQAKDAQAAAEANKSVAERAADRVNAVSGQIDQLSSNVQSTAGTISDTQSQISQQDAQLTVLQTQLSQITAQEDALVRDLYIAQVSNPQDMMLFSGKDIGEQARIQQHIATLNKSVSTLFQKTTAQKQAATEARDVLVRKNNELSTYRDQQQSQQQSLADFRDQQSQLQSDAVSTELALEAKAAQAQAQANQIAQKISLLTTTTSWGSQIISSNDGSWYYTQIGDRTRLGSSSETVNNVGCLITSIAMVSTYYGNHITPDYIARNGGFTGEGYYYWGTPSNLGVNLQPSGAVNWNVVGSQLAQGHPVIVSIYLPSVGAINADGSSHFIVIKGQSGGKYLMHDPIGGGRSYNLNQVRSMILTSAR